MKTKRRETSKKRIYENKNGILFLFLSFCRLAKKKLIRKEKKAEKLV